MYAIDSMSKIEVYVSAIKRKYGRRSAINLYRTLQLIEKMPALVAIYGGVCGLKIFVNIQY